MLQRWNRNLNIDLWNQIPTVDEVENLGVFCMVNGGRFLDRLKEHSTVILDFRTPDFLFLCLTSWSRYHSINYDPWTDVLVEMIPREDCKQIIFAYSIRIAMIWSGNHIRHHSVPKAKSKLSEYKGEHFHLDCGPLFLFVWDRWSCRSCNAHYYCIYCEYGTAL